MEHDIPVALSRELELIGVIDNELPHNLYDRTETFSEREYKYNRPVLDENGEPPF